MMRLRYDVKDLMFNPIMVKDSAVRFNCTPVCRAADLMMASFGLKTSSEVDWGLVAVPPVFNREIYVALTSGMMPS